MKQTAPLKKAMPIVFKSNFGLYLMHGIRASSQGVRKSSQRLMETKRRALGWITAQMIVTRIVRKRVALRNATKLAKPKDGRSGT